MSGPRACGAPCYLSAFSDSLKDKRSHAQLTSPAEAGWQASVKRKSVRGWKCQAMEQLGHPTRILRYFPLLLPL